MGMRLTRQEIQIPIVRGVVELCTVIRPFVVSVVRLGIVQSGFRAVLRRRVLRFVNEQFESFGRERDRWELIRVCVTNAMSSVSI